ncbi:MAG: heterodisulfide reductase-related iron-sulfur binding cluster [Desulfobacteria bacterium]
MCKYADYDTTRAAEQMKRLVVGDNSEIVMQCVTCAACNAYCAKGANPFDLLLQRQEKGNIYKTTESYARLVEGIDRSPGEVIPGSPGRPAINICVVDILPNLLEGRLFDGCTFLRGGEFESLLGWIHVGKEKPLRETLQAKVDALAKTGFREIVMLHDDCYGAYTTKAMEYGIDVPFKVTHYVQYLRDFVRGIPDGVRQLDMKIAYQSPCSSRYAPWIDKTLDELFSLIGVVRVDRRYDRLHALCCGCPVSPHLGREAGESYKNKNIRDAIDHGAEAMVFMCTFCALQMRDEAREAGLEPIFLTNLVRLALGETLTLQAAGAGDRREPVVTAAKIVKGQL